MDEDFGRSTEKNWKIESIGGFVCRYSPLSITKECGGRRGACQKFWNEPLSGTKILICGDGFHSFFSLLRVITTLKKHIDTFRTVNSCDRDHSKWVKYLLTYFVFQLNTVKNLAKALAVAHLRIGMFVLANFVDIYLQGMRDTSMRSGKELAREIKLTD